MCCQFEALLAGLGWAQQLGLARRVELDLVPADRLRLALEQLPPQGDMKQAATVVELAALVRSRGVGGGRDGQRLCLC